MHDDNTGKYVKKNQKTILMGQGGYVVFQFKAL